jgi:AraC-like DNA-binding protein
MKYWYQKPHPSLSEYVRTVLILEGFTKSDSSQQPLFTSGMPALVCRTEKDQEGEESVIQLTLYGKSTQPDCWSVNEKTTVVAYFFKPFVLACIFNIPVTKLMDAPIDLCNWNAHKTNALKTQLHYATLTSQKVEVLDNLLTHQLQQNKKECEIVRYATDQIMCDSGTEILSEVLKALSITERTFQRIFKKYVGVTPNQYRRICQFQLSFEQLRVQNFDKLTDVAYDNGFVDESHFIRSFREFTQVTPGNYLKSGLTKKN